MNPETNPHMQQPVLSLGAPFKDARQVMILLHGRGASAESILSLAAEFDAPDTHFLAPQAHQYRWYPQSFLSPIERNEPDLSNALERVDALLKRLVSSGKALDQIILAGFSQGACLASEYVIRNPRRYAGLIVLSGGWIGPQTMQRSAVADLDGLPVFIGCSDIDQHIPLSRVEETASLFASMNARVDLQIYSGMEHTVNADEISRINNLLKQTVKAG
ncbi:MAG: dienelactone hydrolase family protein [Anaerolineaceae bacterium]|jgi:predicted esterase|nr:dienelactone hydrolase family protein [Anaerolineaceae bacterium]